MTDSSNYQARLGQRLRDIRNQQGMTLQDVEDASDGKWKAVVIGAYERGDRAISAAKLADLASFYGVPVSRLVPESRTVVEPAPSGSGPVKLDLTRLSSGDASQQLKPISRYARSIQQQRGDYNGKVLTIREDDVRALSVVFGLTTDQLLEALEVEGLLAGT